MLPFSTAMLIMSIACSLVLLVSDICIAQESTQLNLTQKEIAWIKDHPEVTVSNEFDWPPFDFMVSGTPQGYGIDLMNLLSERSGIRFKYINGYTWDELVEMFFDGKIDVLHSLSLTPERAEKALFSTPYYHSKNVLVFRSDAIEPSGLQDLEGKIIALPKGWSSIDFFHKNYPEIHIIEVESSRQALEYIDQGKVFATVEQEGIASYFIKKFGFQDLRLSHWIDNDELQKTSSMHFAVLNNNPTLYEILEKALSTIQPDEMTGLAQKWFSREGRQIGKEDVGLTPNERIFLNNKQSISYCISPENMPFEAIQQGLLQGMSADFLEMFSEVLNTPFRLIPTTSWAESLTRIQSGDCEILPMVNKTDERNEYLDFTRSYLTFEIAIISQEKEGFIGGLPDLAGKKVTLPAGVFTEKIIAKKYPGIQLIPLPTVHDCLLELSSGNVEAAVLSLPLATYHIRQLGLDNLKVAGYSGLQDTIRIGIKKDSSQLHSIMSKVVRSLQKKEIDEVTQHWVSLTFEHRFDYSLMFKILAGVGFLMMLFGIWNYQLMRFNKQLAKAHSELEQKSRELEMLSNTDALTGLFNRRQIENKLSMEIGRHLRYQHPLSVVIIDIDNFKSINDSLGHQAGDQVLKKLAHILQSGVRNSDIVGRWGGEEFLITCTESDLEGASTLAEHLRTELNSIHFGKVGSITASFGVAAFRKGETKDHFINRADEALYKAKANGRDRVEIA